ncbi:MAG TPA: ADP-ribosylglycohydrolase family protein [Actinophytocola sp.]|jgi:ADP-ribosylglycohydrolase|uniref:ADP-ribosylglycohydrolase family protein n=1 Tax=Actinophytocola sp. TaxID=1872138 RepID=UPI002E00643A|nr:ADP-ribosylglycohydrolase family protein [Actinophytocola sp.]
MIDWDRVIGAMLAGAVGDALGAPVEFLPIDDIRRTFGPAGIVDFAGAHGGRGKITDETQLTLFTMEGLIRAHVAGRLDSDPDPVVRVVQHAYQRWLFTQGVPWDRAGGVFARDGRPDGWLVGHRELHRRRAPGTAVLAALTAFAEGAGSPSPEDPHNDAKGCGAVMRLAPVALWADTPRAVFTTAARLGALTHGHPTGYLPGGALAVIVRELLLGAGLLSAIETACAELARWPGHLETDLALTAAVELAAAGRPSPELIAYALGGGWRGEQALAIAVCAALVAEDLADGLRLAVNHSGDSDATGAICGNILGALHGTAGIPKEWLHELELREVIEQLTTDLLAELGADPPSTSDWFTRYPGR